MVEELDRRHLGDRAGVISKLLGTLLELCVVSKALDVAVDRALQMADQQHGLLRVPDVIEADIVLCNIDLLRLSTLQRFLLLKDVATVEVCLL